MGEQGCLLRSKYCAVPRRFPSNSSQLIRFVFGSSKTEIRNSSFGEVQGILPAALAQLAVR